MPKTTSQNKTNRKTEKAGTGLRKPPPEFYWDAQPMPSSDMAWRYCAKICKLAWSASLKDDAKLVAIHGEIDHDTLDRLMTGLLDTADALRAMSMLCLGVHARIIASTIKATKAGVRAKPAPVKPRKAA
jgi:hypothetical protein